MGNNIALLFSVAAWDGLKVMSLLPPAVMIRPVVMIRPLSTGAGTNVDVQENRKL